MYINQNSLQYKQFQDFEKYARFICERFDISVQLEATLAETDGKTIYLPNVMSMTGRELELMYAVLLHEAGHIRHSTFSEFYFKSLKTEAHAFLANAIEDARIENLLMKEFDGAKDIFENMYCDYTNDKVLMKKIFKHTGQFPDLFTSLAFYVHNEIINCNTAALVDIVGSYNTSQIRKFCKENDLSTILKSNRLKNDKDVIALTNQIYDLFVEKMKKKDKSNKVDFKGELAEKNDIQKNLDNLHKEGEKVELEIKRLKEELKPILDKIESYDDVHKDEVQAIEGKIEEFSELLENLQERVQWKQELEENRKKIKELPEKINNMDVQKYIVEKERLEKMLETGKDGRGKELTPEKIASLKEKLKAKISQIEKYTQKVEELKKLLQESEQKIQQALEKSISDPMLFDENMDVDDLKNQIEKLKKQIDKQQDQLNKIEAGKNALKKQYDQIEKQIEKIESNFMEKSVKTMFDLDKKDSQMEMGLDIMPDLNYEESWPQAAKEQQKFDEKASKETGKVVRNGQKAAGMFGTNVRDILLFIDKQKEKVEDLDVLEIFKGKISPSKLSDFNSESKQHNFMEDKSFMGVFGTVREHIPLTTQFDTIKKELTSKNISEYKEIEKDNFQFYQQLKKLFAKKFRFAKKDFWKGAQEEGSFDTRNLWKLPTNQGSDFYEVNNPKFINKVVATILVDISGSQSKEPTDYGKKIQALVIGLSQALNEVHIKHEILGYHAPICEEMRQEQSSSIYTRRSNKLETLVVKDFSQKDCLGVMNLEPQMTDNSDGESLRIALKRLKAMRAKSHMIFIISDGKPFLCDTDVSVLDEDFKSALRLAVKEKVQVFGLGFFPQLKNYLGNRACFIEKDEDVLKFFEHASVQ